MHNIFPNHLILFRFSPSFNDCAPSLSGLHITSKFMTGFQCIPIILRRHRCSNSDNLFLHDNHVSGSHCKAGGDQMDWASVVSKRSWVRISNPPVTLVVGCNFLFSAYSNTYYHVKVRGELSISFETTNDVQQMHLFSPFLFRFVIDVAMEKDLKFLHSVRVYLAIGKKPYNPGCADDLVFLFKYTERAPGGLVRIVAPFRMCFPHSKCKILLRDWTSALPHLILDEEQ